jgi:hypothetical protein
VRLTTNAQGERQRDRYHKPTGTRSGRLRLARRGSVVTCLVAEDDRNDFQPIQEFELGTADLSVVRVAADTGNSNSPVEVRIGDFAIQLLDGPAELSLKALLGRHPLLYLVGGSSALLMIGGGLLLWRRPHEKEPNFRSAAAAAPDIPTAPGRT